MQHEGSSLTSPPSIQRDWRGGFQSLWDEYDYWIDEVEGTIPPDLHGTLWRNGPGALDRGGQPVGHPFDGDGMVCRIAFGDGRAHFRNRFVRTKGWLQEQRAGRILYRGIFGTEKPGGFLRNAFDFRLKNIANTNIIYWGDKLQALWEGGHPYRLDPWTLDTLGMDNPGGVIEKFRPFAAHPHIDPYASNGTAHLVWFSVLPGPQSIVTTYEFDLAGHLIEQHTHTMPGFALLHDMAITPNYCIFVQGPLVLNPIPYLLGVRTLGECLHSPAQTPTRIWAFPRHGKGSAHMFETDPCFVFHNANAFEKDGGVVLDAVAYPTYPMQDASALYRNGDPATLPAGQLWRFNLDLGTNTVNHQLVTSEKCEFPGLNAAYVGHSYRYAYMVAKQEDGTLGPCQAFMKVDLEQGTSEVWSAAPYGYANEPLFVPRRGPARHTALAAPLDSVPPSTTDEEDDGWLIALVYEADRHRSSIVILDARHIANGPVARLWLRHHVPFGLHGSFTPQRFGPEL